MPIRNPFTRRPGAPVANDENLRPDADGPPGFERVDTVGSKASSVLTIRSSRSQDNGEYKMSVVNDSGVYLPPSPTEESAQWPRKLLSRTSTDTRSSLGDIEPFSISRESFDSYRRSFDISARSPVLSQDPNARQSLDSPRFSRMPRASMDRKFERQPPTAEENFEDVGLDDQKQTHNQHRKRGFFSKFSDGQEKDSNSQPVSRFLMPGRKRGQSGQGAELGSIEHLQQPKVMVTSEE
ncbi:hypothetical protein B0I35DRAFT_345656 [Stachybotrys elegans]|uniref:Uncharacterized protein n=1 Tax=Stachybotrys elegans TaxID=80388 RepID=A0A8K0T522_9HYPO|nr:hypothetical protein B0I35DRAFT_345656 [Stachybotrys elegans]